MLNILKLSNSKLLKKKGKFSYLGNALLCRCQDNCQVWNTHTAWTGMHSSQFLPSSRRDPDVKAKNVFWKYYGLLMRIKHRGSWTTKDVRKLPNHSHIDHNDLCRHELQYCFPHFKKISHLPNSVYSSSNV